MAQLFGSAAVDGLLPPSGAELVAPTFDPVAALNGRSTVCCLDGDCDIDSGINKVPKQPGGDFPQEASGAAEQTGNIQEAVDLIVKEYTKNIANLARLTEDLPRLLNVANREADSAPPLRGSLRLSSPDSSITSFARCSRKKEHYKSPVRSIGFKEALDPSASSRDSTLLECVGNTKHVRGSIEYLLDPGADELDVGPMTSIHSNGRDSLTEREKPKLQRGNTTSIQADALAGRHFDPKTVWATRDSEHHSTQLALAAATAQVRVTETGLKPLPSQGDFEEAQKLEGCARRFVGSPGDNWRIAWELLGVAFVLHDLVAIPLTEAFRPPSTSFTKHMEWVVLFFWTVNVFVVLTTGYISNGLLVLQPYDIFRNYCRTWLTVDVLTILPDWVFMLLTATSGEGGVDDGGAGPYMRALRMLRLLRLARLLRLVKLRNAWNFFYDMLDSEKLGIVVDVFKMVLIMIIINHYVACCFFVVAAGQSGDNWMKEHGFTREEVDWGHQYIVAYHWSITQFTPSSMHVQPQSVGERVFAIWVVIFALVGFSYLVGSITGSLARLRTMGERKTQLFWLMRRFLRKSKVPTELAIRVKSCVQSVWDHEEATMRLEGIEIFKLLSDHLKAELALCIHAHSLGVHPLLFKLQRDSVVTMRRLAISGLSQRSFAPDDVLFFPGEVATHMSMYLNGQFEYRRMEACVSEGEDQPWAAIDTSLQDLTEWENRPRMSLTSVMATHRELLESDEDWIAEPALWVKEWHYLGQMRSVKSSELLKLDPATFAQIISLNPVAFAIVHAYVVEYTRWLNKTDKELLSDVTRGEESTEELRSFVTNPYCSSRSMTSGSLDMSSTPQTYAQKLGLRSWPQNGWAAALSSSRSRSTQ